MTITNAEAIMTATKKAEIFFGVDEASIKQLLDHQRVKYVTMKRGQNIYHHGDVSDKFWLIMSGEIVAQVQSLRHPFHKLRYCPGDVTGLRGIVDPGKPRPVTMIADSDVELIEIPGEVIMAMDSQFWGTVMSNIARVLLERLLARNENLDH